jgi:hypothetical protein
VLLLSKRRTQHNLGIVVSFTRFFKEAGPSVEDFSFTKQFPQIFREMATFSNFHGSLLSCGEISQMLTNVLTTPL